MARKPPPVPQDWEVIAVVHIVDGDTVDLEVRRPVGELAPLTIEAHGTIRVRLVHLDTPERGQPGYHEATDDLEGWLNRVIEGTGLRLVSQGQDSFGRYLGDIYSATDRSDTASDYMVRERNWSVWTG